MGVLVHILLLIHEQRYDLRILPSSSRARSAADANMLAQIVTDQWRFQPTMARNTQLRQVPVLKSNAGSAYVELTKTDPRCG